VCKRALELLSKDSPQGLERSRKRNTLYNDELTLEKFVKSKESEEGYKVTIKHIKDAYEELFLSEIYPIKELPMIEKYFIVCVYKMQSLSKDGFSSYESIIARVQTQLNKINYEKLSMFELTIIFDGIVKLDIFEIKSGIRFNKVKLKIDQNTIKNELDDVIKSFND
jgi:hypothetical protein